MYHRGRGNRTVNKNTAKTTALAPSTGPFPFKAYGQPTNWQIRELNGRDVVVAVREIPDWVTDVPEERYQAIIADSKDHYWRYSNKAKVGFGATEGEALQAAATVADFERMNTPKDLKNKERDPAKAAAWLHAVGDSSSIKGKYLSWTDDIEYEPALPATTGDLWVQIGTDHRYDEEINGDPDDDPLHWKHDHTYHSLEVIAATTDEQIPATETETSVYYEDRMYRKLPVFGPLPDKNTEEVYAIVSFYEENDPYSTDHNKPMFRGITTDRQQAFLLGQEFQSSGKRPNYAGRPSTTSVYRIPYDADNQEYPISPNYVSPAKNLEREIVYDCDRR